MVFAGGKWIHEYYWLAPAPQPDNPDAWAIWCNAFQPSEWAELQHESEAAIFAQDKASLELRADLAELGFSITSTVWQPPVKPLAVLANYKIADAVRRSLALAQIVRGEGAAEAPDLVQRWRQLSEQWLVAYPTDLGESGEPRKDDEP